MDALKHAIKSQHSRLSSSRSSPRQAQRSSYVRNDTPHISW